jgi:hypothetical protein
MAALVRRMAERTIVIRIRSAVMMAMTVARMGVGRRRGAPGGQMQMRLGDEALQRECEDRGEDERPPPSRRPHQRLSGAGLTHCAESRGRRRVRRSPRAARGRNGGRGDPCRVSHILETEPGRQTPVRADTWYDIMYHK